MGIGLERGTVAVVPYDPSWVRDFELERVKLADALGPLCLQIEHVGSTAVPGLAAKPLIDILIAVAVVPPITDPSISALDELGYELMPERAFPGRLFLPKGPPTCRTHHLSLVQIDSSQWRDPLRFRDALRANPALVHEYETLKYELASSHSEDRGRYTESKSGFIRRVLEVDDPPTHGS